MFCSKACKEEATKTFHRDEATNVVVGIVNSSLRRMAINMYCNAFTLIDNSIEDFQDHICVNDSGPRTIFDFDLSNPDETINDKNRLHAMFSLFGVNFSGTNNIECFQYFLKRVEMIVFKYTFLTFSQKLYGIYSFGSLLNHSCAPNVIVYQFEEKNVYFVVRPISKGQQLFVSYK